MNFVDHLPDAWFDIIAKLIPGAFAVAALHYFGRFPLSVGFDQPFVLLLIAYVIGHCLQPVASIFARTMTSVVLEDWPKQKSGDSYEAITAKAELSRNVKLTEKAYAEAVSFYSIFIICTLMNVWLSYSYVPTKRSLEPLCLGMLLAACFGLQRTFTQVRRMRVVELYGR